MDAATKPFRAVGDFRLDGKMIRKGDGPVELTAAQAKFYLALRKVTPAAKSRRRKAKP